jgi:cation transport ATPase
MSRALNIDATIPQVVAMARKHDIAISAIEALDPDGTRVVMVTGDAAAVLARAFGRRVLTGSVTRAPWRQQNMV